MLKKRNDFFILKNKVLVKYGDGSINVIDAKKVLSPVSRYYTVNNYGCSTPYFRN